MREVSLESDGKKLTIWLDGKEYISAKDFFVKDVSIGLETAGDLVEIVLTLAVPTPNVSISSGEESGRDVLRQL